MAGKSVEELLDDLIKETRENKENLEDINSAMSPLEVLGGIATKIFGAIIDAMKQLDAIKVSNADLLVDTTKLNNQIIDEGYQIGTLVEHSQTQLNLTRIGYKQINKDLREQLVFLDKAGGQGQDLVRFMATMVEKGATEDTITVIADKIANIARFTGQSARAAIAAAEQLGDNYTVLAALGLDESVMAAMLEVQARDEFPKKSAAVLGAFVSEMIDPKNFQQAFLQDRIAAGNALLDPTVSIAQKADIITDAVKQSAAISTDFLEDAGNEVLLMGQFRKTFVGAGGIAAIQLEAAEKMLKGGKDVGTGAHRFSDANAAYMGSFLRISDKIADAAQKAANIAIDLIGGDMITKMGTLVDDMNALIVVPLRKLAEWWNNKFGDGGDLKDPNTGKVLAGSTPMRQRGVKQKDLNLGAGLAGPLPTPAELGVLQTNRQLTLSTGMTTNQRKTRQSAAEFSASKGRELQEELDRRSRDALGGTFNGITRVEVVKPITLGPDSIEQFGTVTREGFLGVRADQEDFLRRHRSMTQGIIPFDF